MVPSAEKLTDGLQRGFRHLPAKIHRDLPGKHNFLVLSLGGEVAVIQIKVFCDQGDDELCRHLLWCLRADMVL